MGRYPFVLHWNGQQWRADPAPPGYAHAPSGIAARAPHELFITSSDTYFFLGGGAGVIQHWKGTTWETTKLPYGEVLDALASAPAGGIWAVGFTGTDIGRTWTTAIPRSTGLH